MIEDIYISVVIPNHNRSEDVSELLGSLSDQNYKNYEVIVADDGSTDDSVQLIRKEFPDVRVVVLEKNQGPAIARNKGIEAANGDLIVGLDSDVILPDNDTLTKISLLFRLKSDLKCAAFRISNYYTGNDDVARWWHPLPVSEYAGSSFNSDYFSGTGFAFRREVFEKVGCFPDYLFMFMEENDLAFRILDAGYDIRYSPEISVIHKASVASRNNRIEYYYKRRNQIWVAVRYFPIFMMVAYLLPRLCLTVLLAFTRGKVVTSVKSLFDAVVGLPDIIKIRRPLKRETWRKIKVLRKGVIVE